MLKPYIILLGLLLSAFSSASPFPNTYDREFKNASFYLPPGTDWRLLKAQCYQESRLIPTARSPVGAMGLCQFMPATWDDMQRAHPHLNNPWVPEMSIIAAARYMRQLNDYWHSPRPQMDRYMLALASYNAGAGNITRAQRKCDMKVLYKEIMPCLPDVTGRHSEETKGYVRNIVSRWWPLMLLE